MGHIECDLAHTGRGAYGGLWSTDLAAPVGTDGAVHIIFPNNDTIFGGVEVIHCRAFLFVVDTTVA